MSIEHIDTLVIGGGQAGLAAGYHLAQDDVDFRILDAGSGIGAAWRTRWDSLRLFTPSGFCDLPGLPFPGHRARFPGKDEMADYLERYAAHFDLPVRLGTRVDRLTRAGDRLYSSIGDHTIESRHVIVATGPTGQPRVPGFAGELDTAIHQVHSTGYRNPDHIPGPVLVVGAGNSGAEIALELAKAGHHTTLAGRDTGRIRLTVGGPVFRALTKVLTVDHAPGRRLAARFSTGGTPLVRVTGRDLDQAQVRRVGRVVGVRDGQPLLADGTTAEAATVVWCTGFTHDYSWIQLPAFTPSGYPNHHRGVITAEPGLYFLGLPFQTGPGSHIVGGVGADADYICNHLTRHAPPVPFAAMT